MPLSVLRAALVAFLVAVPLLADRPTYSRSSEVTIEGTVVHVGQGSLGVYLLVKESTVAGGPLDSVMVQLAPSYFLADQRMQLVAGDAVRIIGSRVIWNGAEMILARAITHEGRTVALRDPDGSPRW